MALLKRNLRFYLVLAVLTIATLTVSSSGFVLPRNTPTGAATTSSSSSLIFAREMKDGEKPFMGECKQGLDSSPDSTYETANMPASEPENNRSRVGSIVLPLLSLLPILVLVFPLPTEALAAAVLPTALWAYAHYFSILVITACLAAERTLVKPQMTVEDEDTIVKLDLIYGAMAFLLIGSGFARSSDFGKGSEYYLHEILFWIKMTFAGIWGGLSIFPSLTFYKRNYQRKKNEIVPPLSEPLATRLRQIINAEISAIFSIPLLAALMARGVWYWEDFPWQIGLATAIVATVGSFFVYAKQALTWTEDDKYD